MPGPTAAATAPSALASTAAASAAAFNRAFTRCVPTTRSPGHDTPSWALEWAAAGLVVATE
jgi:hypothetical protein